MAKRFTLEDCTAPLEMLTQCSRVATDEQLHRLSELYPVFRAPSALVIRKLLNRNLLTCQELAIRLPELDAPLFRWAPDHPPLDSRAMATELRRRKTQTVCRSTRLLWATDQAVALVGGVSGLNRQPLQVEHDLLTTEVYLHYLRAKASACPELRWCGEDILRREYAHCFPTKMPDAAIIGRSDYPTEVIEVGGVYSADDLRDIHKAYAVRRFRYELW
jgi:hypothetical protein